MNCTAALFVWGMVDTIAVNENDLNEWWSNEHLPERLSLPAFHRAYRYCSPTTLEGKRKYLALYDVNSLYAVKSPEYLKVLKSPTPKTAKFMPLLNPLDRSACEVRHAWSRVEAQESSVAAAVGNWIGVVTFDAKDDGIISATRGYEANKRKPASLLSITLYRRSEKDTLAGNATTAYAGVKFQNETPSEFAHRFVYVMEFALVVPGDIMQREAEAFMSEFKNEGTGNWGWEAYQLICCMDAKP